MKFTITLFIYAWWLGLCAVAPRPIGPPSNVARFLAFLGSGVLLGIALERLLT